MNENIKTVLKNYDQILALILEQKVDEFADKMDEMPPNEDDVTYEQYLQHVAMEETDAQSLLMEQEPNELLDGKSMNEYFKTKSFDELTEILEYCALELDRGVPSSVVAALASVEDKAKVTSYSASIINDAAWVDEELKSEDALFEMEFQKVKACFKVLEQVGDSSLVSTVIDRFMSYPKTLDFVADSIAEYLVAFPDASIPVIMDRIAEHKEDGLEGPCEDLLIILTRIGKEEPSDDIYNVLRSAFRYMTNKIYAVICLADYGDERAIPMMKTYINRHQSTISRDLFYEMMSAIQHLGGDIADISDPFGDFQKKMK